MSTHFRLGLCLAVSSALACSANTDSRMSIERVAASAQATDFSHVQLPSLPLNTSTGNSGWHGSRVDLMVGDALAECSTSDGASFVDWAGSTDVYLDYLLAQMQGTRCNAIASNAPTSTLGYWFAMRGAKSCAFSGDDSTSGEAVVLEKLGDEAHIAGRAQFASDNNQAVANAEMALRRATGNLCLAERLRARVPGAMSGEAVLLSAEDQRELLEVLRERSQVAMLQYAQLSLVSSLATASGYLPIPPTDLIADRKYISTIAHWATTAEQNELSFFGDGLARAVRLHAEVSREVTALLARSGDARQPRGGSAQTPVDEFWGPGSWRNRALSALYGGDPLAIGVTSLAPWGEPQGGYSDLPGRPTRTTTSGTAYRDWADGAQNPYPRTAVTEPQVAELERFARSASALNIKVGSSGALDADASAMRLYLATEASLRTRNCVQLEASGVCHVVDVSEIPALSGTDTATSYQSFELWSRYRITPVHALTLARELAESLGAGAPNGTPLPGTRDFDGQGSIVTLNDEKGVSASWYHVPSNGAFHEKKIQEVAPLFTRLGRHSMWNYIEQDVTAAYQGIGDQPDEREGARLMGSIPALMAARAAIERAQGAQSNATGFLNHAKEALAVIDAAVGLSGVSIEPSSARMVSSQGLPSYAVDLGQATGNTQYWNISLTSAPNDTFMQSFPGPAYDLYAVRNTPAAASLVLYPGSKDFARNLSLDCALIPPPKNSTAAAPCTSLTTPGPDVFSVHTSLFAARQTDPARSKTYTFGINLPQTTLDDKWTFFLRKATTPATYALLASSVSLDVVADTRFYPQPGSLTFVSRTINVPNDGQYIGYGGSLGQMATGLLARDGLDLTRPASDAFGIPTRWAPPSAPELFAGSAGEDAVHHYLSRANDAATQATSQVKDTFSALLQQATDQAQLAAAQSKANGLAKIEGQALCGPQSATTCNPKIVDTPFDIAKLWDEYAFSSQAPRHHRIYAAATAYCNDPTNVIPGNPSGQDIAEHMDCLALFTFAQVPKHLRVFSDVAAHVADPVVPTFQEYEGGTIQKTMISQWVALKKARDLVRDLLSSIDAALVKAAAFNTIVERDSQRWDGFAANRCSPETMAVAALEAACGMSLEHGNESKDLALALGADQVANGYAGPECTAVVVAVKSGLPVDSSDASLTWLDEEGGPSTSTGTSSGFSASFYAGGSWGTSDSTNVPGALPVAQRRRMCQDVAAKLEDDQANAVGAAMEAFSTLAARMTAFVEAIGGVVLAGADGATLVQQSRSAEAKANLDAVQTAASQTTSLHLWQHVNSYDVWRAQALLLDARVAAVTARRAIEARYAVDMSTLTSPEPFVASPSTWADDIYEYDLDMPRAVGLSVGASTTDGIYPNRVLDYVANLSRFVDGFAVARPSAVASADTDLLSLPGPLGLRDQSSAPIDANSVDGQAAAWAFECPTANGLQWMALPPDANPNDACLPNAATPLRARTTFSLDPWGRVNGDVANEPYVRRYNARWSKLAINLVGTGVIDCEKASDPAGCYSQPFVRYSIEHTGPTWVSDWSQSWQVIGVPVGTIEGAKALASEQWLDPVVNGWGKPYVDSIARTEFDDRPFGGTYDLTLECAPEDRLDRIQRVQVLLSSSYWVKQQ